MVGMSKWTIPETSHLVKTETQGWELARAYKDRADRALDLLDSHPGILISGAADWQRQKTALINECREEEKCPTCGNTCYSVKPKQTFTCDCSSEPTVRERVDTAEKNNQTLTERIRILADEVDSLKAKESQR
jgi:hypothetical protein